MKLLRVLYPRPVVLPLVLTLLAAVGVLALACATPDEAAEQHGEAEATSQIKVLTIASHEEGDEGTDVLEITLEAVEGRPWRFEPAVLELHLGQRVKLTLVNDGRVEHDVQFTGVPADHIELVGGEDHQRLGGGNHLDGVVAAHAAPGTTRHGDLHPYQDRRV